MNTKLESLCGCFALLGLLILPVVLFLTIVAHDKIVSGKQVTVDRARASLLAALSDVHGVVVEPKQYGYFMVRASTNTVVVDGGSYLLSFVVLAWGQFENRGTLAVTTNRQFIWLDNRRGAKLISDSYKVPKWRTGY